VDETVAADENCLVILTKKRTIGLEAKSKMMRDFWVQGLEWLLNLYRAAAKDGDTAAAPEDQLELDPMLLKGGNFTKHGLRGITRRFIKCSTKNIYWLKKDDAPFTDCIDPIAWDSVSEILQGKQTLMFSRSRAREVQDSLCLSIVYRADNRSLDLVADTEEQAFEWYSAMNGFLQECKDLAKEQAANKDKKIEAELAGLKAALAAERESHSKKVKEIESKSGSNSTDLAAIDQARADLSAKFQSKETEMERMKKMMSEEKDQLVKRIEDLHTQVKQLTSQLDTALTENQRYIVQLQEARKDKIELDVLRTEVARVRQARAEQATELSAILAQFNSRYTVFYDSVKASK